MYKVYSSSFSQCTKLAFLFSVLLAFFLFSNEARGAQTYYIDFSNGNNSNTGLSTSSPWKTLPGSRTVDNQSWLATSWGPGPTFSSSSKVPPGTIFKIKSGVTYSAAIAGQLLIDTTFYSSGATTANPIKFERDTTWGTGSVTFDGTNIVFPSGTGWGLIHIRSIGGVVFDGKAPILGACDGFVIKNSRQIGLSFFNRDWDGATTLPGGTFKFIKFINDGTQFNILSGAGAGSGQLYIGGNKGGSTIDGVLVDHCEFDGNNLYFNGLNMGQSNLRLINAMVTNCKAYNFQGNDDVDVGMGFKAQNSQITWIDCEAYGCLKGWDPGEDGCSLGTPSINYCNDYRWPIVYKMIRCYAHHNTFGINCSGPRGPWNAENKFYIINCIIRDNQNFGSKFYAGPYTAYLVHNFYANNGCGNGGNLAISADGYPYDPYEVNAYMYNNIFYAPCSTAGYNVASLTWQENSTDVTWHSDFNSYLQGSAPYFVRWGYWYGTTKKDYKYGSNGPGHTTGSAWSNDFGVGTSAPTNGATGHYSCDRNSKGTGASDTTLPPFKDVANHDYTLTSHYQGMDISTQPWFIAEMGLDRSGTARTSWDIGPYEFVSTLASPNQVTAPQMPQNLTVVSVIK